MSAHRLGLAVKSSARSPSGPAALFLDIVWTTSSFSTGVMGSSSLLMV